MKYLRIVRYRTAPPTCKQAPATSSLDLGRAGTKTFDVIKDGNRILDYRDVFIRGYLSTFQATTPADRDGDAVKPGAFKDSIPEFMTNPVLLVNHDRAVSSIAGRFTVVREDSRGLYIEAMISNSPTDAMRHVRALVAEGILRTLSMGGRFHYEQDGRTIHKVDLREGSLVCIPANPDALFTTL